MPEQGQHTSGRGRQAKSGPNCPRVGRVPPDRRGAAGEPGRFRHLPHGKSANTRCPGAILAGLPAHVMDECVEDMAEAVVGMLLSQATTEANERDDASGGL